MPAISAVSLRPRQHCQRDDRSLFQFTNADAEREQLESIAATVDLRRYSGECDRHLAHRAGLALTERIVESEALLDLLLSLSRSLQRKPAPTVETSDAR
jgi:hypothetical protein